MGSPADLAVGYRAESPIAVGNVFKAATSSGDRVDRVQILDDYLKALKDERRKIEAFKRELPHCMQLLDYAIDASKENLVQDPPSSPPGYPMVSIMGKTAKSLGLFGKEVVQEFLKSRWETRRKDEIEEAEKDKARRSSSSAGGDHPTWMAEAQLWSQPSLKSDHWKEKESSTEDSVRWRKDAAEQSTLTSPTLLFNAKQRPGGAFMPFVKEKPVPSPPVRSKAGVTEFILSSGESQPTSILGFGAAESGLENNEVTVRTRDVSNIISQGKGTIGSSSGVGCTYSGGTGSTTSGGGNAKRKARRCWSPELHRRFVSALQQLGGSQIATPKQIRELMKVDGLTNDEVKSHLQKYRLHTRRPSPTPQGPQQTSPQLVVLGGIWVPPEYGHAGVYHDRSRCVSQREPIFCQPSISQEFYSQLHPSVQIELHRSPSHSSPHGPLQSNSNLSSGARQTSGEVYRDDSVGEDGKSESSSWKGEHNSRESSENDEVGRENGTNNGKDEDDTDEAGNGRDSQVRLQLQMSCSSVHSKKTEPPLA